MSHLVPKTLSTTAFFNYYSKCHPLLSKVRERSLADGEFFEVPAVVSSTLANSSIYVRSGEGASVLLRELQEEFTSLIRRAATTLGYDGSRYSVIPRIQVVVHDQEGMGFIKLDVHGPDGSHSVFAPSFLSVRDELVSTDDKENFDWVAWFGDKASPFYDEAFAQEYFTDYVHFVFTQIIKEQTPEHLAEAVSFLRNPTARFA